MPWLFRRCNYPGCEEKVKGLRESLCSAHLKQVRVDYDRSRRDPSIKRFYNSDGWKRLRGLKLDIDPLCQVCGRSANTVDHKQSIKEGVNPYDMNNLQSLCFQCHSRKHAVDGSRWGRKGNGKEV